MRYDEKIFATVFGAFELHSETGHVKHQGTKILNYNKSKVIVTENASVANPDPLPE